VRGCGSAPHPVQGMTSQPWKHVDDYHTGKCAAAWPMHMATAAAAAFVSWW